MYKIDFIVSHHVFPLFISSMISMIACLPLAEFESKLLTVMSSSVPCRNGIPITLITADCSNRVLMNSLSSGTGMECITYILGLAGLME